MSSPTLQLAFDEPASLRAAVRTDLSRGYAVVPGVAGFPVGQPIRLLIRLGTEQVETDAEVVRSEIESARGIATGLRVRWNDDLRGQVRALLGESRRPERNSQSMSPHVRARGSRGSWASTLARHRAQIDEAIERLNNGWLSDADEEALSLDLREFLAAAAESSHYDVLGVRPDASHRSIVVSARAAMRRYHPAAFYGQLAPATIELLHALLQCIADAYDVLGHEQSRTRYDREVRARDASRGSVPETAPDPVLESANRSRPTASAPTTDEFSSAQLFGGSINESVPGVVDTSIPGDMRVVQAREFFIAARADLADGELVSAKNNLKLAVAYDPSCERYKRLLTAVRDQIAAKAKP